MEYETVIQKERRISVKIKKGNVWEEVKQKLCHVDKKHKDKKVLNKNKLVLDVRVKREFRQIEKDGSWVGRLKTAFSNRVGPKSSSVDNNKKELFDKESVIVRDQPRYRSRSVRGERRKDRPCSSPDKERKTSRGRYQENSFKGDKEIKNKDGFNSDKRRTEKNKQTFISYQEKEKLFKDEHSKNKNKKDDANCKPNESDDDTKFKRNKITRHNRSKSKPSTASEKWQYNLGKGKKNITSVTSSIISLRNIEDKARSKENEKKKNNKLVNKRCLNNVKPLPYETLKNVHVYNVQIPSNNETREETNKSVTRDKSNFRGITQKSEKNSNRNDKPRIRFDLSSSDVSSDDEINNNIDDSESDCDGHMNILASYSSSSNHDHSSTSSEKQTCSCGCMNSNAPFKSSKLNHRIDSSSSCSSIEYLRSYSGNLVMCAHGKKPILNDHIRYLSSCSEI